MSSPTPLASGVVHLLWAAAPEPRPGGRRAWLDRHLRRLLAPYAGCPPEALRFEREPRGRPFVVGGGAADGLDFNLSDTQGGCLLAVARDLRLGVDLERLDRRMPALKLAERYFAAVETAALRALPDGQREQAFLELWTAKEAACKSTGSGLRERLEAWVFDLGASPLRPRAAPAEAGDLAGWHFQRLQPAAGYIATLAVRGPLCGMELREAPCADDPGDQRARVECPQRG